MPLWLTAFLMLSALSAFGQRPCRDTLVYRYDSICEGETYDFNGRELDYTGLFFDTIQRANSDCDSIIILRLTVLLIPEANIYPYRRCEGNKGYDLYSSSLGNYFRWSSVPTDTMLRNQMHNSWVHVNPQQPTTYYLYVDYRPTPQCPDSSNRLVNPIAPVVARMHITPDELTLDHMEFTVEDFSTGTREYYQDGWGGRHWYINGVHQDNYSECATFSAEPWWPDTVEVMMLGFSPTCLDSVTKLIPFKKIALHFPNLFTPGKEENSLFRPILLGVTAFEMWIYDRRGTLVFHSQSADTPWDGTYQGTPCPSGSYVYRCRYRDIYTPEGDQTLMGTVTLLR
jgi:gliding motility-associated-like protein